MNGWLTQLRNGVRTADVLKEAVRPLEGQIPGFIHTAPEVYDLERDRIFRQCWLFVAHESEIPMPGDYVTRTMAEEPVIVARGEDGNISVLLNVCRHRGMRVCRADTGNSSHFRCPYHGFTFRNNGDLIGIPLQKEIYGDAIKKEELGLVKVRSASYRGLIFATWNDDGPSLEEYLGDMKWYLDLVAGRAEMEVVGHPSKRVVKCNWKFPAENFIGDSYHTMIAHASIAKIGLAQTTTFSKTGYQIDAGNGHGANLGYPTPGGPVLPEELFPIYEQNLSPEQFEILKEMFNMPSVVFPNLAAMMSTVFYEGRFVSHSSLHLIEPRGHDRVEWTTWLLVEKDAPEWWKQVSRKIFVLTFSPSGIFDQDDMENFSEMTSVRYGITGGNLNFDYTMGMGARKIVTDFVGPGTVYDGKYNEASARAYYQHWLELMTA